MDVADGVSIMVSPLLGSAAVLGKTILKRQDNSVVHSILHYSTENILTENPDILTNSTSFERYNRNIIPDALALSCDIYAACSKDPSKNKTFHTKSFSDGGPGWVYIEDYFHNMNSFSTLSNCFKQFLLSIRYLEYNDEKRSGLGSGVFFQYIDSNNIRIAYVTKGTATRKDALTDLEQGLKAKTPQYQLSLKNAKLIKSAVQRHLSDKGHLYYFGHSLGGGLANYNAMGTNVPSITFNAASVHPDNVSCYVDNYNKLINTKSMVGIYVEGEILSTKVSPFVGLPKNGNRYKVNLDPKYLTNGSDPINKHLLEPLCAKYGLSEMTWTNKIFIEI